MSVSDSDSSTKEEKSSNTNTNTNRNKTNNSYTQTNFILSDSDESEDINGDSTNRKNQTNCTNQTNKFIVLCLRSTRSIIFEQKYPRYVQHIKDQYIKEEHNDSIEYLKHNSGLIIGYVKVFFAKQWDTVEDLFDNSDTKESKDSAIFLKDHNLKAKKKLWAYKMEDFVELNTPIKTKGFGNGCQPLNSIYIRNILRDSNTNETYLRQQALRFVTIAMNPIVLTVVKQGRLIWEKSGIKYGNLIPHITV